jgi:type I restriction enzyme S subunit
MSKTNTTTWRKVKLGEVVDVKMGQSPSSKFYNYDKKGLPFFQGVTDFGEKYPKKSIFCSEPIKIAEKGDILFSVRAPVGDVNISIEKSCIGRGVASLVMKNKNNDFLYFLLKNYSKYFKGISGGTTYESINKDQIEGVELFIPEDVDKQKRIAGILSAFDDKIELNNKINQNLEQMAQAIFKEWFTVPSVALAKEGKLPKDWKIKKLGEIATIEYGKGPSTKDFKKTGYPVYGANGIIGYSEKYIFEKSQIIIGCRGVVGSLFRTLPESSVTHNSLIITPIDFLEKNYLFMLLKNSNLQSVAGGSAQPQITIKDLSQMPILFADQGTRQKFEKIIDKIEKKRLNIIYENQKLAVLRDLLLPKLMSGEIRV